MSKSRHWSNASAPCRLEWRPSRVFVTSLRVLGGLGAVAVFACELPWPVAALLACIAIMYGEWVGRRERRRPTAEVVIPANGAAATIDGLPMEGLQVQWRGPLVFLSWRDGEGRRRYLQGWPDNLAPAARRELRLAMDARVPAHSPRSVAP